MSNAVTFFRKRFKAEGDADDAKSQQAYMKSTLKFHGVTAPLIHKAVADYCKATPLDHDALVAAVEELFATDWFDLRSAAIGILARRTALLSRADAAWLITLVRRTGCWAHVDWLATKIVPRALDEKPHKQLRAWAKDEDFWVRRTALLAQHDELKAGRGDFDLFCELALPMLGEREFFIRKAIGWVLREVSKKRPALVRAFVNEHGEKMSGLTRREATRRMAPE